MNDRAWEDLIDLFDQKYKIDSFNKHTEALPDNHKLEQTIETADFTRDGIKYRLSRVTTPAVIDRKSFYHRTGRADHAQNIYDESELTHKVTFYKEITQTWQEIAPEDLMG